MIDTSILTAVTDGLEKLYGISPEPSQVQVQRTRPEFDGDFTLVVFPLIKISGKNPEETAREIGELLSKALPDISGFNIVKGFLNLKLFDSYWLKFLDNALAEPEFGFSKSVSLNPVVVEFSSPNTNKPLHLGHIRNNLIGWSISEILQANGLPVIRVNLVNDRGIHICKTMLAYRKWHDGRDPVGEGLKGDKFVGDLYVQFESANRKIIESLVEAGLSPEEAYKNSPLTMEAVEMLQAWERNEPGVRALWEKMNGWVYAGFNKTYERMGIRFDKVYHESDTYLLGKELVKEGLEKGIFRQKDDGSVWVDLVSFGLDEKLILRSDGTSVYITQDLGTAQLRHDEFHPSRLLYVVGNEQNYHFEVLQAVLKLLGRDWAGQIHHVSYGMVELPTGKMKSREGTVVDADDLLQEMYDTAAEMTYELGKSAGLGTEESKELFEMIGQGALKYFMLRVDPKKNMLFNPEESIDFNGNTGPFIQYTHARIRSLLKKAKSSGYALHNQEVPSTCPLQPKERAVLRLLHEFPAVVADAGKSLSPALIANFTFELAREYNQFYQEVPVLREEDHSAVIFRLKLSELVAATIRRSMKLLGIKVPERM
jgi:arginyl-tRNA synthetase